MTNPTYNAIITFLVKSCSCKDLINKDNVGNCKGRKPIQFKQADFACYVVQPSNCSDLKNSTTNPGEKLSVEACHISGK